MRRKYVYRNNTQTISDHLHIETALQATTNALHDLIVGYKSEVADRERGPLLKVGRQMNESDSCTDPHTYMNKLGKSLCCF